VVDLPARCGSIIYGSTVVDLGAPPASYDSPSASPTLLFSQQHHFRSKYFKKEIILKYKSSSSLRYSTKFHNKIERKPGGFYEDSEYDTCEVRDRLEKRVQQTYL
jgi:hypothetical protein